MAIDQHFIPAFSIEDVLLDKDTGAPLSGGLVYFEQDNQRGTLKPVYQLTGTSPNYQYTQMANPIVLSSIGTFEDSLGNPTIPYFYPYDANGDIEYYYIRVTNANDVPQFDREAQPYVPGGASPVGLSNAFQNELSNPQFAQVLFDTDSASYTYNFNAVSNEVVPLGPDWDLVVTSPAAGTVTVKIVSPIGTLNDISNPGTILNITSGGLSSLRLRQRFYGSPNLWGHGNLAASFVAKKIGAGSAILRLLYSQSDGLITNQQIIRATLPGDGAFDTYPGTIELPASTSTQSSPDAYVDIEFDFPLTTEIELTSVMLAPTGGASINDLVYEQAPLSRQIDHLFHYYQPAINFKPIPSMLTGWDFPLNPAQINSSTVTMNTSSAYIWDQTIGVSVVGNIAVVRNAVTGGIQATTANALEAFCYTQYLTGEQAQKILGTKLSVNVSAFRTQAGGAVTCNVYLFRGSSAAVFPTLPLTIGGATPLAASGVFTKNNTAAQGLDWTEIPRGNLGLATGDLSIVTTVDYSSLNDAIDLQFSGWEITDTTEISDTDKFAIVVTFECPTTATVVVVNSISVVPGEISTRPAPQTRDQVIDECYAYYESSKPIGVPITSSDPINAVVIQQFAYTSATAGSSFFTRSFGLQFRSTKIKSPTVTLYTLTGLVDNVLAVLRSGASGVINSGNASSTTLWTQSNKGIKGLEFLSNTTAEYINVPATPWTPYIEGYIEFHYIADARLGV